MKKPSGEEFLKSLERLHVDRSSGQRKPHKPLLLLLVIEKLLVRQQSEVPFSAIEAPLQALLEIYAPPVVGKPHAELPYWHLQSDGIWEISGLGQLKRTLAGTPTMAAFRKSSGHIPSRYARLLQADAALGKRAIKLLLDKHFEPSLHADILSAVGLDALLEIEEQNTQASPGAGDDVQLAERAPGYAAARAARGSTFRAEVLAAYDHRCAVSGFQAMLAGTAFCLEAAHVHWHSQGGPSTVDNGLALTPTLHKLFDHGAWTLDDQRRVLVSRHFSGSDSAITELRAMHGRPLRAPVPGTPPIALDFIRWHREQSLGGVFRGPAIAG